MIPKLWDSSGQQAVSLLPFSRGEKPSVISTKVEIQRIERSFPGRQKSSVVACHSREGGNPALCSEAYL